MWLVGFYYPKGMNKPTEYCPSMNIQYWCYWFGINRFSKFQSHKETNLQPKMYLNVLQKLLRLFIDTHKAIRSVVLIFRVLELNYYRPHPNDGGRYCFQFVCQFTPRRCTYLPADRGGYLPSCLWGGGTYLPVNGVGGTYLDTDGRYLPSCWLGGEPTFAAGVMRLAFTQEDFFANTNFQKEKSNNSWPPFIGRCVAKVLLI